jgi:hypothetical protein
MPGGQEEKQASAACITRERVESSFAGLVTTEAVVRLDVGALFTATVTGMNDTEIAVNVALGGAGSVSTHRQVPRDQFPALVDIGDVFVVQALAGRHLSLPKSAMPQCRDVVADPPTKKLAVLTIEGVLGKFDSGKTNSQYFRAKPGAQAPTLPQPLAQA